LHSYDHVAEAAPTCPDLLGSASARPAPEADVAARPKLLVVCATVASLALLASGCSGAATSNGACEPGHEDCIHNVGVDSPERSADPSG
jgi:hypothetical protein